jgi:hypothetical protein
MMNISVLSTFLDLSLDQIRPNKKDIPNLDKL